MDKRNNLFSYATSELSQDAFICWLASWSLEGAKNDSALKECAKKMLELFVPELAEKQFTLKYIQRQIMHIDVLLTLTSEGKEYKVVVEDKTYTSEHDDQLNRYLLSLKKEYPECIVRGVYYKTGFQADLSRVKNAGYQIITRAEMLELMAEYVNKTENNIFSDYYEWWNDYHQKAMEYKTMPLCKWDTPQICSFYDELQNSGFAEKHSSWISYGYVANRSGGFEGL